LRQNSHGKPYVKSLVKEYIVYDKKTKKGRVSPVHKRLLLSFVKHYLNYSELIVDKFICRLTPTLCKKMAEGKITCVEDILKYHRSYTVRKKDLDLKTLYKFIIWKGMAYLHILEDPENIVCEADLDPLVHLGSIPFKFKTEEIPQITTKYAQWIKEQSEKYDTFRGQRNEECRPVIGTSIEF
jgi:hypothetical protein